MKKLLIVEDDLLSQDLFRRIFKNELEIDICESSEEFYAKYSKILYDLIIMDIALKGKKLGTDLISEIRKSPFHKCIPIICLTAHAHAFTRTDALKAGADVFFTKPVHNTLLKETAISLINRKINDELIV